MKEYGQIVALPFAEALMRGALYLPLIVFLASCGGSAPPPTPSVPDPPTSDPSPAAPPPEPAITAVVDPSPLRAARYFETSLSGIRMEGVRFDGRSHHLILVDQPGGPGSKWSDCRGAGKASHGIAAINAGFFTPEGESLGRVVASGRSSGSINRASSLGSGFYQERSDGVMSLIRREQFKSAEQALQSGPLLTENGRRIEGLSSKQSSARSFIATDGHNQWMIVRSGACSLDQLGRALSGQSIDGMRISTALNLDGGRSSEIWVSERVQGGPAFTRPFWNKPVRNYLILSPRN